MVHTHSDVDKSNSSYYGTSGLYLLSADGEVSAAVPQSKEGQIHEVQWSPKGDRYAPHTWDGMCSDVTWHQMTYCNDMT